MADNNEWTEEDFDEFIAGIRRYTRMFFIARQARALGPQPQWPYMDITTVIQEAQVTKNEAITALNANNGDYKKAILWLKQK